MSTSSIDGLVSGLNTTQIISQLMQVAAAPQTALKTSRATEQVKVAAYQDVNSKMAAILSAAKTLDTSSTWQTVAATSNDSSVTATASAGATAGTFGFDVTQTAAYETQLSSSTFASLSASAATSSSLTFTKADGSTVSVTPTDGSLSSVVSAINGTSGLGVRAAPVALGDGTYALQLTSSTTGAAAGFSVSGLGTMSETSKAQDAQISISTGTGSPITISSTTNTFTNVLPGLTFTVTKPTAGVRIDLASDSSAATKAAQGLVDAANSALDAIAKYTAYDPSTKTGGPLTGDWAMRSLQQSILSTVSTAVGGVKSAADAGIQLTQDGHLSFDAAKFQSAFAADSTTLKNLLGPTATFAGAGAYSGTVSLYSSSETTQEVAGGHSLVVTQAASRSTAALTVGTIDATTSLTVGSTTITGQAGETAADFAARVNSALGKVGYSAALSGATLTVSSNAYGATTKFAPSVAGSGLTVGAIAVGADVAGTIDGKTAIGSGQLLTAASSGAANGMTLLVTLTTADVAAGGGSAGGRVNFAAGVAQRLATLASSATDSVSGSLTSLISSGQSQIKTLGDEISGWDVRLAAQQQALQVQYANLEVALGQLKDQSSWLAGQISGLSTSGK